MNAPLPSDDELELAAMRAVAGSPASSQRELAATLGISVGKTNYLLRALLEKGLLKVENFSRSDHKLGYLYLLTPSGVIEKARLTRAFLARKESEYEQLQRQIDALRDEVNGPPTLPPSQPAPPNGKSL